ncbi:MAG: hypothetical protein IJI34_03235 [Clostridia bacterium]|nr:hypothetical protein [Clostridia bacterium]
MKKKKDTKSSGESKNGNNSGSYLGEDFLDKEETAFCPGCGQQVEKSKIHGNLCDKCEQDR